MAVWEEIVDYTVPSNTTSVDFTGLNITKDDFIKVSITHINPQSSNTNLLFLINNDTSGTGYQRQLLFGNGSSLVAARTELNQFASTPSNSSQNISGYIKLSENDKFNLFINRNYENGSGLFNIFHYLTTTNSYSIGVDSLTFESSPVSNAIGAGSRIQIYKLTAEKVADVVVNSNTTQVDITGLNITKDSEYLLVSDWDSPSTSELRLSPNDLTNNTNYYSQRIVGFNSSPVASRSNTNSILNASSNTKSIAYTHIKLSNIEAFTAQSYGMRDYGTSTVYLVNRFVSSTYENISNITKLNLVSSASNGIGSGTRFQLYKLY